MEANRVSRIILLMFLVVFSGGCAKKKTLPKYFVYTDELFIVSSKNGFAKLKQYQSKRSQTLLKIPNGYIVDEVPGKFGNNSLVRSRYNPDKKRGGFRGFIRKKDLVPVPQRIRKRMHSSRRSMYQTIVMKPAGTKNKDAVTCFIVDPKMNSAFIYEKNTPDLSLVFAGGEQEWDYQSGGFTQPETWINAYIAYSGNKKIGIYYFWLRENEISKICFFSSDKQKTEFEILNIHLQDDKN